MHLHKMLQRRDGAQDGLVNMHRTRLGTNLTMLLFKYLKVSAHHEVAAFMQQLVNTGRRIAAARGRNNLLNLCQLLHLPSLNLRKVLTVRYTWMAAIVLHVVNG